jgi:cyanophycinase-like exopeptidase
VVSGGTGSRYRLEVRGVYRQSVCEHPGHYKRIGESDFLTQLKQRYIEQPIVIAGTSAGAMAMSTPMIQGIGIEENTAVVVREGVHEAGVGGSSQASIEGQAGTQSICPDG